MAIFVESPKDILHIDDRIIDQFTEGHRQSPERHCIDRHPADRKDESRNNQRQRNSSQGNKRRTHVH